MAQDNKPDAPDVTPTSVTTADVANAKNLNLSLSAVRQALDDGSAAAVTALTSIASAVASSLIGGTTGATANRVLVSKGTGGHTLQATVATLDPATGDLNLPGTLGLEGSTSGVVTIQPQAVAGTFNLNLPITAGTSGYVLTSGGGGSSPMTWTNPAFASGLTVGSTAIAGGTNTRILYDNSGTLGEYTVTGSGTVVAMKTTPTFATSITTPSVLATGNDSGALGASGTAFSDLFLASGGVINWNAGNYTITHSAGLLTTNGKLNVNLNSAAVNAAGFSPLAVFVGADGATLNEVQIQGYRDDAIGNGLVTYLKARGTAASPAAVNSGDQLGANFAWGYATSGGAGFVTSAGAGMTMAATEAYTSTAAGSQVLIKTTPNGSVTLTTAVTIDQDQSLRIHGTVLRIDQTQAQMGASAKTFTSAADSTTNIGHYFSISLNGNTYYVPCSSVAPTG